jgi:hypothetical protein
MPTPFPGMDPYLEQPLLWPHVHNAVIAELRNVLASQLRPRYYVALEERTYMAEPAALTFVNRPDVTTVGAPSATPYGTLPAAESLTGTEIIEPVVVELPIPEAVRETYLEVRLAETHAVITVLELLSPANKRSGEGRQQYERKRLEVLATRTHLVEIDLLRVGEPMVMYTRSQVATSHYRILLSRAEHRPRAMLFPFSVREPIPSFHLPLQPEDDEPVVELNDLLHALYDRAGYDLRMHYHAGTIPPLDEADAAWADRLLRTAGVR